LNYPKNENLKEKLRSIIIIRSKIISTSKSHFQISSYEHSKTTFILISYIFKRKGNIALHIIAGGVPIPGVLKFWQFSFFLPIDNNYFYPS